MDDPKVIQTDTRTYQIEQRLPDGLCSDLYLAKIEGDRKQRPVLIKIAAELALNRFLDNEADKLGHANQELKRLNASRQIQLTLPELIESFEWAGRSVVVTDFALGYFTLEQVRSHYPHGVPPDHTAWIFNRMLTCIMATHSTGLVHGNVLPCHMLIRSGNREDEMRHTGVLVDWTCAVRESGPGSWPKLTAMDETYEDFYPAEVKRGKPVSPQTDLAMAAACGLYLLGGNVKTGEVPDTVPWQMVRQFAISSSYPSSQ